MRVVGIDPGTVRTGYGVVETAEGRLRRVASGVIAPGRSEALELRLLGIHDGLLEVIESHRPEAAAVEDVFFAKHAQGALKLGHARGVCLLAAARAGLPVFSYPPALVKRSISGHGRADKEQVARLVTMLLGLPGLPAPDESDALSIAICHATGAARAARRA